MKPLAILNHAYLVLMLCGSWSGAAAQGVLWDQRHLSGGSDQYFMIPSVSPVGQQFTPSLAGVDIVSVVFGANDNSSASALLHVYIHRGADIFGPVIGVSQYISLGGTASGNGFIDFVFAQRVALVPGQMYAFEVRDSLTDPYGLKYSANSGLSYPSGQAIVAGNPVNADLVFR